MKTSFILLGLLVVASPSFQRPSHHHSHLEDTEDPQRDFDYLVLRQIWPKTSCMFPNGHKCTIDSSVSSWVVHGLWPNYNVGYPSFCNKTDKFDPELVKSLIPVLEKYWPNLYSDTPLDSFWEHEWEKHGTCALSMPQVRNERDYFELTLGLREKLEFGVFLEKSLIIPDNNKGYELEKIVNAIKSKIDVEPVAYCFYDKEAGKQFLSEMEVCLNKKLELIECTNPQKRSLLKKMGSIEEEMCKSDIPVVYPVLS